MQDLNQPGRKRASFISELRRRKVWLFGGTTIEQDWGELQLGLSSWVSNRTALNITVDVSSDFDDNPTFGGSIGFNMKL